MVVYCDAFSGSREPCPRSGVSERQRWYYYFRRRVQHYLRHPSVAAQAGTSLWYCADTFEFFVCAYSCALQLDVAAQSIALVIFIYFSLMLNIFATIYHQIQSYLDTIGTGSSGTGGLPGKGAPLPGFNTGEHCVLLST